MSKGVLWFTVAGVFQITYGYKLLTDSIKALFFEIVLMVNQAKAVLLDVSLWFNYQVEFVLIEPLEKGAASSSLSARQIPLNPESSFCKRALLLSATLPAVMVQLTISPRSLMTKCTLKP